MSNQGDLFREVSSGFSHVPTVGPLPSEPKSLAQVGRPGLGSYRHQPVQRIPKLVTRTDAEQARLGATTTAIRAAHHYLHPVMAETLAARGFEPGQELDQFLAPALEPYLALKDQILNLDRGAKRLVRALENKEQIALACDFDVDGISSGVTLFEVITKLNGKCSLSIPDRLTEGYGLNERIVREAHSAGAQLLVTLDFGTSRKDSVSERAIFLAQSLGMEVLVLDHHSLLSYHQQPADILINSQQPGDGFENGRLCTAGLVGLFISKVKEVLELSNDVALRELVNDFRPESYYDFECVATVADQVPHLGYNRAIIGIGKKVLGQTGNLGLGLLKEEIKTKLKLTRELNVEEIAFYLAPIINAVGRIDNALLAVELFTTSDRQRAQELVNQVIALNERRKEIERAGLDRALQYLDSIPELPSGILVYGDYHPGVAGIMAARLNERFQRPALVFCKTDKVIVSTDGVSQSIATGSGRSPESFDMLNCFESCAPLTVAYGGHPHAMGASAIETNMADIAQQFDESCRAKTPPNYRPEIIVDSIQSLRTLKNPALRDCIREIGGWGRGNPEPQFLAKNLTVVSTPEARGGRGNHFFVSQDGLVIKVLNWQRHGTLELSAGDKIDLVCTLTGESEKVELNAKEIYRVA